MIKLNGFLTAKCAYFLSNLFIRFEFATTLTNRKGWGLPNTEGIVILSTSVFRGVSELDKRNKIYLPLWKKNISSLRMKRMGRFLWVDVHKTFRISQMPLQWWKCLLECIRSSEFVDKRINTGYNQSIIISKE